MYTTTTAQLRWYPGSTDTVLDRLATNHDITTQFRRHHHLDFCLFARKKSPSGKRALFFIIRLRTSCRDVHELIHGAFTYGGAGGCVPYLHCTVI